MMSLLWNWQLISINGLDPSLHVIPRLLRSTKTYDGSRSIKLCFSEPRFFSQAGTCIEDAFKLLKSVKPVDVSQYNKLCFLIDKIIISISNIYPKTCMIEDHK